MLNAFVREIATGSLNRRRMLLGLAAVSTTAGAQAATALEHGAPQDLASPPDLAEVVSIFDQLNPGRKARMLATLRDCLTAQRIIEPSAPDATA